MSTSDIDSFILGGRDLVAVSCLSSDRSFAVRNNGKVMGLFGFEESEQTIRNAIKSLPENSFIQLHRSRWEGVDRRFLSITTPYELVQFNWNPLTVLRFGKYMNEVRAKFHQGPDAAFEKILEFRASVGLTGENLFKVGAERLAYQLVGNVTLEEDLVETPQVLGTRGFYRFAGTYGAALDIVAFMDLEGEFVPEGAFYSTTTIRRLDGEEADLVRVNSSGARIFSGHLKREIVDPKEMMKLQPYGFSHTVIMLDPSHKRLTERINAWSRKLLTSGVATSRLQLRLKRVLQSALPGQGDFHPSCLYLDQDTCCDVLVRLQRSFV